MNSHLLIIDPRDLIAETFKKSIYRKPWFREIHHLPSDESALKHVRDRSLTPVFFTGAQKTFVLIGGFSYLRVLSIMKRIEICLPNARIVLLDDTPKFGCTFIADRHALHGCMSLFDSLESCCDCLDRVTRDLPALTPTMGDYLEVDFRSKALKGRKDNPFGYSCKLSEKEWYCFRHLVGGRDLRELVEILHLKPRSVRNLQYHVMNKLGVRKLVDLIRLASQWGLLEEQDR